MVWGKSSDRDDHKARSQSLTAAYDKRGRSGPELNRRIADGVGSRGGAPIWVMREAWMPAGKPSPERIERLLAKRDLTGTALGPHEEIELMMNGGGDQDGFAVYGRYPHGFLDHVIKTQLLGDVRRQHILHVCSGTLSDAEAWTVDLRAQARPRVQASGTALPFRDASFRAVMLDPPYSDEYARNLYKTENPRPSWLLKDAARVVVPGGRIGILHVAIPFSPPGCRLVTVYGISTGVGFRIRAFTIYEREQASLFDAPATPPGTSA